MKLLTEAELNSIPTESYIIESTGNRSRSKSGVGRITGKKPTAGDYIVSHEESSTGGEVYTYVTAATLAALDITGADIKASIRANTEQKWLAQQEQNRLDALKPKVVDHCRKAEIAAARLLRMARKNWQICGAVTQTGGEHSFSVPLRRVTYVEREEVFATATVERIPSESAEMYWKWRMVLVDSEYGHGFDVTA